MSETSDFLAGALVGGVAGLVAGILLAPAPGKETRERIAQTGGDLAERAQTVAPDIRRAVDSARRDLMRAIKERLPATEQIASALRDAEAEAERDEPLES